MRWLSKHVVSLQDPGPFAVYRCFWLTSRIIGIIIPMHITQLRSYIEYNSFYDRPQPAASGSKDQFLVHCKFFNDTELSVETISVPAPLDDHDVFYG